MKNLSLAYIKEKWQHAGFQKYFRSTGWMLIAKVFTTGIGIITAFIVARKLGPLNFGQLSYATSFISIFSILASLGIDNVLYRDLVKYPERKREFLGTGFAIKLVAGTITACVVSTIAYFFAQNDVSKTLIIILSGTFIFGALGIVNYEFQARVKSKWPSVVSIIAAIILNALEIWIVLSGRGVIYLALVTLFQSALFAALYWFIYEKKVGESIFTWKFDLQVALTLLRDAWPLIFTSAFVLVYSRIDQVFIKNMIGAQAVGIYGAAVNLAEGWYFIPTIIIASLFPAMINAKLVSENLYYSRLRKFFLGLVVLAISIAVPVTIFASILMRLLYGAAFASGAVILQIYIWSNIGAFLGNLATSYLIAENRRGLLVVVTFVPMIANVILNLFLIPTYGIAGSAWATLISYSLGPMVLFLFKEPRKIFAVR